MKVKGKIETLGRNLEGGLVLSLRIYEEKKLLSSMDELKDKTLNIEIGQVTKQRSLSSNAMYWLYVGRLAAKLRISTSELHNRLLRLYGAPQTIDGEQLVVFVPDTEEAEKALLMSDTMHLKKTSALKQWKDGSMRRMYMVLKGSHEYTTGEMSTLINGLMDTCNECGVPTATPEEVAEAMRRYEKHHPER
jgi:hypothetical protein